MGLGIGDWGFVGGKSNKSAGKRVGKSLFDGNFLLFNKICLQISNMNFRHATEADNDQILHLYHLTARLSGGIARTEPEITPEYVQANTRKALTENGLIMVAEQDGNIIGEIHAHQYGIRIFRHILTNATLVVHPYFQGKSVGKQLLTTFLNYIRHHRTDIRRVELESRATNQKSIALFKSTGFEQEGVMKNKTRNADGSFEDSLMFAWENPDFDEEFRQSR